MKHAKLFVVGGNSRPSQMVQLLRSKPLLRAKSCGFCAYHHLLIQMVKRRLTIKKRRMMTVNSYQKKAIRERMKKTGETYLNAARQLAFTADAFTLPWKDFNQSLDGGFKPGNLYLFGSRPGDGATTLSVNFLTSLKDSEKAVYLNGAMSEKEVIQMTQKMYAQKTGKAFNPEKIVFVSNITQADDVLFEESNSVETNTGNKDIKILIIDSLELLEKEYKKSSLSPQMDLSQMLKIMSNLYKIPVIIFTQLSRNHNHTSTISDFRNTESTVDSSVIFHMKSDSVDDSLHLRMIKNRLGNLNSVSLKWDKDNFNLS